MIQLPSIHAFTLFLEGQNKKSGGGEVCWLKLCLIGYTLSDSDSRLYDKLRSHLGPQKVYKKLLPDSCNRGKSNSLLPHRGEILEFNRQVPLSRPLFDGFGFPDDDRRLGGSVTTIDEKKSLFSSGEVSSSACNNSQTSKKYVVSRGDSQKENTVINKPSLTSAGRSTCVERLPNGWTKKAEKDISGKHIW